DIVLLIFLREFVITAARTAYSRRDVSLKTTYIAKVKTWYQMITSGLIFLLGMSPPAMRWVTLVVVVGTVVGGAIYWAVKRQVWRGALAGAISFGALLAFVPFDDQRLAERAPLIA